MRCNEFFIMNPVRGYSGAFSTNRFLPIRKISSYRADSVNSLRFPIRLVKEVAY